MLSSFFSKNSKDKKEIVSGSSTAVNTSIVHSSSETTFTRHVSSIQTTETRTTTIQKKFDSPSPLASSISLNSFLEKHSSASGGTLGSEKRSNFSSANSLKPTFHTSVSVDANPFKAPVYQLSPSPSRVQYPTTLNSPSLVSSGRPRISYTSPQNYIEELKQKVTVNVKRSEKFYDDPQSKVPVYKTRSRQRGKALIINNIKFVNEQQIRKGAELDEKNVKALFVQLGFETVVWRNLNKKDMESKIQNFRDSSSLKKVDIGAVVIMSHGTGEERSDSTEVACTDNSLLSTTWIINQFDRNSCPHLKDKPKIFIFQCCRGNNRDIVQHDHFRASGGPRKPSDMLIAYSTVPGFVSHREPENGTWYIQAICKVFMDHAHDTHVEDLLKIVDNQLSSLVSGGGAIQTTSYENRGFKICYLHPKLYEK